MPDELTGFEERVVGVAVEVFDELQDIGDNGFGDDFAFVKAIVVEEAIQENVLEGFGFDASETSLGKGGDRVISGIPGDER
jgi:hypothetical protein